MKTFLTKSKSSLLLAALISLPVWAKPVAQVTDISGKVFVITAEGETKSLKLNDHLDLQSEVMVDEGASISLNDYYDATYHLTGGTHMKFYDKSVQLKQGKTWIQAQGSRHPLALTTANGHVDYWKGEFITTFDQSTSRSQVLVVNGDVEVSNILDKNMKYTVSGGSFTMVDPEVENGIPRAPTRVGLTSLNNALGEFKKLPHKVASTPTRAIASVKSETKVKKGEIIFIKSHRLPASVSGSAHSYYKKSMRSHDLTAAPIKFYGVAKETPKPQTILRIPASVAPVRIHHQSAPIVKMDPEFESSLKKEVTEQPKHSKELQSLIEELNSY